MISPRIPQLHPVPSRCLADHGLVSVRGYTVLAQTNITVVEILTTVAIGPNVPSECRDRYIKEVVVEEVERSFGSKPKDVRVSILPRVDEFRCTKRSVSKDVVSAFYSNKELASLIYGLVDLTGVSEGTRTLFEPLGEETLRHLKDPGICLSCNTLMMLSVARNFGRHLIFRRHLQAN